MMRNFALGVMLAGITATTLYVTSGESQAAAPAGCQELYKHEPVLIYDVTGATLTGPIHQHVAVYNDGFVSYSAVSGLQTPFIDARTAHVSQLAIKTLKHELATGGAFQLCDQPMFISDIPLTTVTVFRGDADAYAHSFSYWIGVNQYSVTQTTVSNFIATHFPGT